MPQIMEAHAVETRTLANDRPWPLQVRPGGVGFAAVNHEVADLGESADYGEGRGVQYDASSARFTVGELKHTALEINVRPAQMQDFTQSAAGEQQKAQGHCGERRDAGYEFAFRNVLGRRRSLVDRPWHADRLSLADRRAESFQLRGVQKPLAAGLAKFADALCRIKAVRQERLFGAIRE